VWQHRDTDFTRSTTCPHCGADVYFVRHNGGSVWFDELGPPWDKHACFDDDSYGVSLRRSVGHTAGEPSGGPLFGVVLETVRQGVNPSGRVVVRCSDGSVIDRILPHALLPVGQLVLVRWENGVPTLIPVTPDNDEVDPQEPIAE
jgi:hypothetical protein